MLIEYLGVAQFGSVLEWGSRGREFESPHSDQIGTSFACSDFFVKNQSPAPRLTVATPFSRAYLLKFGFFFIGETQTPGEHNQRLKVQVFTLPV